MDSSLKSFVDEYFDNIKIILDNKDIKASNIQKKVQQWFC